MSENQESAKKTRVVLGPRAVHEALRARPGDVAALYFDPGVRDLQELLRYAKERGVRGDEKSKRELSQLVGSDKHQNVVAIMGEYVYAELEDVVHEMVVHSREEFSPFVAALDEITDPHNLGAIVRSAVAFGAHGVLTLKDRAAPVTPVVVRVSAGATEHARIVRVTNLARTLTELRDEKWMQVVGLDADGDVSLDEVPPAPEGRIIVVGAEGKGLRPLVRKQCTVVAKIAMAGPLGSLNTSVAAGIAFSVLSRKK